jgi:hypothetical protein
MTVWYAGWDETITFIPPCISDGHPQRVTNTRRRIDRVISPYHGHIVARNMSRIEINIERRNCAPGWFYLQDYTRMHGQQNIKKKIKTFYIGL